jgi:hypothetical protein
MHQQVGGRESDFQAVPRRHEAKRPEQRRAKAARDPKPVFYSSRGSMLRKSLILLIAG